MTAPHIVDPAGLLSQALTDASPDLRHELLGDHDQRPAVRGRRRRVRRRVEARSTERTNYRNGYRHRPLDTPVGTVDVAIPKLRSRNISSGSIYA